MEQLTEFIESSKGELESRRPTLEEIQKKILNFLDDHFIRDKGMSNVIIQGRVKGTSSLSEKIVRKRYADRYDNDHEKFINELPDLVGIRLLCLLLEQEKTVFENIQTTFSEHDGNSFYSIPELVGTKNNLLVNHTNQPEKQQNQKEIFRLSCKWINEEDQVIHVEFQIKSLINMFWGEIEHMLFYKNYTYMIGSEFYSDMMNSIFKSLVSIDSQMQLMSLQLSHRTKEDQLREMKQMFAKLMYNMFFEKFREELIDIEVDLREIYDLIVQIEFKDVPSLARAQSTMTKILTLVYDRTQFTNDLFVFDEYIPGQTILREERKGLGVTLGELSKSNDVYWTAFIGLYKFFTNKHASTEIIDSLVNDLMFFYSRFDSIFDPDDEGTVGKIIVKKGIEMGIVHAFSFYKKLDYFLVDVYQGKIFIELHVYLKSIKDRFITLSPEEVQKHGELNILNVLMYACSLKITSIVEKKIGIEYLTELYTFLNGKEISGILFDLVKLEGFVSEEQELLSEQVLTLFVQETNGEED